MDVSTRKITSLARSHIVAQDEDVVPEFGGVASTVKSVKFQNVINHRIGFAQDDISRH